MRKTLLVGLVLTVTAVLAVLGSAALDLELEPAVLLGVAVGAVVALVPDRGPLMRLAGFVGGLAAAWMGYVLRAAVLPDSPGGRAVAVGLVIVVAVALAALSFDRIPLWVTLLGAGALAGAYEYAYAAAPPEVASTSVSSVSTLLLTAAVGFLAAAVVAPAGEVPDQPRHWTPRPAGEHDIYSLDEMMENPK
jgi:hypothetical protein